MIPGFEQQTYDLTDYELLNIVPILEKNLKCNIGKSNPVTNKQICNYLNENGIKSNGPRIRKIINYLRIQGYVPGLCATGSGYYIAANKEEYIEYIASFSKRVSSMLVVLDAAKRDLGELYNVVYSIPHLPTTQDLINMSVD